MMRWTAVLTAALTLGLSACGGGIPGLGGSSSVPAEQAGQPQGAGGTFRNLALYGGPSVPQAQQPGFNLTTPEFTCPEVGVLENGAAYRGNSGTGAKAVNYQASLGNFARECIFEARQVRIRVGVEGRLLLGENGRPGTYSVPVRVVVKRRQDIVTQRVARLTVTVSANDTQAEFAHIEENIIVPITENDPGAEYDVYVALDATGAQAQRQTRRR